MVITVAEVKALAPNLDAYTTTIETQIPLIEEFIVEYCNNHFSRYEAGYKNDFTYIEGNDLTFAGATITDNTEELEFITTCKWAAGDNFYLLGSQKNDGHYDIKTITDTIITVGDLYSLIAEDSDKDYYINLALVKWPTPLKLTVAAMIEYNILYKYKVNKNINSEKIGDYSVSFTDDIKAYPSEILQSLTPYKNVGVK